MLKPALPALALAAILATPALAQTTPPGSDAPPAPPPTASNPWVTLAPMPAPATGLAGISVNGRLYVFGGIEAGSRPKGLVLEYDPATDTWTRKKPMPQPAHHLALAAHGDRIFVFGGFRYPEKGPGGWQPLDTAWEYVPADDAWTALEPMPTKRGAAMAAALNGKIYVIGGAAVAQGSGDTAIDVKRRHDVLGTVEEYDVKTGAWRARAALPTPRNHAAAAVVTGLVYVVGGRIGSAFGASGSATDIVEAYDPAADAWSVPLERMPTPRAASGFAMWRNIVLVAGSGAPDARFPDAGRALEAFDPAGRTWTALPPMPDPARGFAAAVIGDRLYLAGGEPPGAAPGDKAEIATLRALQLDVLK